MFNGLRTAIHRVGELDRAKEWCDAGHPAVLRLGLQPDEPDAARVSTGAVAHWSADDADAAFGRLLELGARGHSGIRTPAAAVRGRSSSTYGNVLGVIENPHFSLEHALRAYSGATTPSPPTSATLQG